MEVSAHEVRGSSRDSKALLDPLAQEVEPAEMGFLNKKCEAFLLDSEYQSQESGRKGSWGGQRLRKESRVERAYQGGQNQQGGRVRLNQGGMGARAQEEEGLGEPQRR